MIALPRLRNQAESTNPRSSCTVGNLAAGWSETSRSADGGGLLSPQAAGGGGGGGGQRQCHKQQREGI